jgi:hypothetical protein
LYGWKVFKQFTQKVYSTVGFVGVMQAFGTKNGLNIGMAVAKYLRMYSGHLWRASRDCAFHFGRLSVLFSWIKPILLL